MAGEYFCMFTNVVVFLSLLFGVDFLHLFLPLSTIKAAKFSMVIFLREKHDRGEIDFLSGFFVSKADTHWGTKMT